MGSTVSENEKISSFGTCDRLYKVIKHFVVVFMDDSNF